MMHDDNSCICRGYDELCCAAVVVGSCEHMSCTFVKSKHTNKQTNMEMEL